MVEIIAFFAFNTAFDNPEWKYFKTNRNEKVVEFNGQISKGLRMAAEEPLRRYIENTVQSNEIMDTVFKDTWKVGEKCGNM